MNVDALLRELTGRQFIEWFVYAKMEPFGDHRADYHAAQILAMLANIYRDPEKTPRAAVPEDFLLKFKETEAPAERKKQSWKDLKRLAKMWTDAQNRAIETAAQRRAKVAHGRSRHRNPIG